MNQPLLTAIPPDSVNGMVRRAEEAASDAMWSFVGKQNAQKIERKHWTLRTRIKRLTRKTICFSRSIQMHDIVIGLFVNRSAFGLLV